MVNGRISQAIEPRSGLYGHSGPLPHRPEHAADPVGATAREIQLSVLLAHPHRFIRESMAAYLRRGGIVVREGNVAPVALRLAQESSPDIMLIDCEFPEFCEVVLKSIRRVSPHTKTAVLASSRSPGTIVYLVRLGAMNWLSPDLSGEEFVNALRMIGRGDVIVSREATEYLRKGLTNGRIRDPLDSLSERERQVLTLLAQGATNKDIAEALIITENTAKVHLRHILDKLDLRNRQQVAAFAVLTGLVREIRRTDEYPGDGDAKRGLQGPNNHLEQQSSIMAPRV